MRVREDGERELKQQTGESLSVCGTEGGCGSGTGRCQGIL